MFHPSTHDPLRACFPRPLPSLAPSIIPGRSSNWILAPCQHPNLSKNRFARDSQGHSRGLSSRKCWRTLLRANGCEAETLSTQVILATHSGEKFSSNNLVPGNWDVLGMRSMRFAKRSCRLVVENSRDTGQRSELIGSHLQSCFFS